MSFSKTNRTIHKWASILIALPILLTIATGTLLLLKKEISYIQPASMKGIERIPTISFNEVLNQAQTVEQANISTWQDIDRLDVRPNKGIIKIRSKNQWEIQIDSSNAEILQVAYRRSDFIETLHDATFFQDKANLWLMLPSAIILLLLWLTGLYLFIYPYFRKRD
ncbi:PepSY-associated TM helix domain-containing protein [Thalassotalea psychrophila]|uniref:PepSY-associated TM helix domain-containing protein n=1 Tax=Thalassotalea psychrophila TaxID=3065647 RepID=A0ABY9TYJ1_9GAMM|nr:PepSY-associated TM helix domain-containing protein [Colwelliaceae bacterium SQ149]